MGGENKSHGFRIKVKGSGGEGRKPAEALGSKETGKSQPLLALLSLTFFPQQAVSTEKYPRVLLTKKKAWYSVSGNSPNRRWSWCWCSECITSCSCACPTPSRGSDGRSGCTVSSSSTPSRLACLLGTPFLCLALFPLTTAACGPLWLSGSCLLRATILWPLCFSILQRSAYPPTQQELFLTSKVGW